MEDLEHSERAERRGISQAGAIQFCAEKLLGAITSSDELRALAELESDGVKAIRMDDKAGTWPCYRCWTRLAGGMAELNHLPNCLKGRLLEKLPVPGLGWLSACMTEDSKSL